MDRMGWVAMRRKAPVFAGPKYHDEEVTGVEPVEKNPAP